jgi:hypothetical protein
MVAITKFEVEFVERTIYLLKSYDGEYKLSNAINCTLGLIVLPSEYLAEYGGRIWEREVSEIPELKFLRIKVFTPIHSGTPGDYQYYPKTLKFLLKKLRNGITHQHIDPINTGKTFTGIVIKNYFPLKPGEVDTEIDFSREDLERFALFIADQYLELKGRDLS